MNIGEVVDCPHCVEHVTYAPKKGTGLCEAGSTASYDRYSCEICLKAAGVDPQKDKTKRVMCSVCKGKGKLWIGADATKVEIEYHTLNLNQQLENKLDEIISTIEGLEQSYLVEKLNELIAQQQQILETLQTSITISKVQPNVLTLDKN